MGRSVTEQIFELKFTSKQLVRQSKKSAKEEKAEKLKVKKAIGENRRRTGTEGHTLGIKPRVAD